MTSQMAREIHQQPAALRSTIDFIRPMHDEIRSVAQGTDRVLLFGRGSSDTAATYGRYFLEAVSGLQSAMGAPSIATLYRARLDLASTLVVICSQSGHTEELVEVCQWATGCGARVIAITNDNGSPLADAADLALVTQAGTESAIPATKSHTTCLVALAELALALMSGSDTRRQELLLALDRTPEVVKELLAAADQVDDLAARFSDAVAWCVAGRGFTYPTALELALKIEETMSMPCLGMSQADLQHGPVAVLGPDRPLIIAAASVGPSLPGLRSLADHAHDRGAPVIALSGDCALRAASSAELPGPQLPEEIAPIALVAPGQLLVEALARAIGRDPDNPTGLSKVTQTN